MMGIIYSATTNEEVIASALTGIYLGYAILIIVVSSIVSHKMKQVFFQIVKDGTWFFKISGRNEDSLRERKNGNFSKLIRQASVIFNAQEEHLDDQNDYFWGSNPSHVVTIAQVGQFG